MRVQKAVGEGEEEVFLGEEVTFEVHEGRL